MKALFCDLGLHLWGELDFQRDLIACDLCGHQVTAEDAFQRGNTLPPMRQATGTKPDWLRRPDAGRELDTVIRTRLPDPDPIGPYGHGIDWAVAWLNVAANHLPLPVASQLRVGPGVADYLKLIGVPQPSSATNAALSGVPIIADPTCSTGEWRLVDQDGNEQSSGLIPALTGMPTDVKVMTSPLLPPGVTAIAYSPTTLRPDDIGYPLYGVHAVAIKDNPPDPG